jgi:DNA-binding NarL/FixJ family response regulator
MKSIVIASRYKNVNQSIENTVCLIKKGYAIATVTDEAALNDVLKNRPPDILLIEAHFAKCASAYVVALLRQRYRNMRIAVFELQYRTEFDASRFILFGAESYFPKSGASELYHRELALMLDGETYMSEEVKREVDEAGLLPVSFKFGKKQRKILDLLSEGKSYKEIAEQCRVSKRTVRNNISAMYAKAGIKASEGRVKLLLFAVNRGFINERWVNEIFLDSENGLPTGTGYRKPKLSPLMLRPNKN